MSRSIIKEKKTKIKEKNSDYIYTIICRMNEMKKLTKGVFSPASDDGN